MRPRRCGHVCRRNQLVRCAKPEGRLYENAQDCQWKRPRPGRFEDLIWHARLGSDTGLCQTSRVTQLKFGTDGWRAVIAEDFSFHNVARVAQAAADYWKSETKNS